MTAHNEEQVADEVKAIRALLGTTRDHHAGTAIDVTPNDRRLIADDSLTLLGAAVRDLGADVSATVRVLLAAFARRTAVAGFLDNMADQHGLASTEGVAFAAHAVRHQGAAQRALRMALSTHAQLHASSTHDGLERLRAKVKGNAT
jgi:hypothetical protein